MRRVCIKDRVCRICGREFRGDRFKCPKCRYRETKATGKFGADYHRKYYKRYLSADSPPRRKKSDPKDLLRQAALAKQTKRIHAEMAAIREAGYSPERDYLEDIIKSGVNLDCSFVKPHAQEKESKGWQ